MGWSDFTKDLKKAAWTASGGDVFDALTGKDAAEAAKRAANKAAKAEQKGLAYLQERERLPMDLRDQALRALGLQFGLADSLQGDQEGEQMLSPQSFFERSPIYQQYQAMRPEAEEEIARKYSASGGLNSGNIRSELATSYANLDRQAYQDFTQGLKGFTALQSNAPQIAQSMANIGQTRALGITGAAQAEQAAIGNLANIGLAAATAFSDVRLKENIRQIGEKNGIKFYKWNWNKRAASELGLTGSSTGVIAQEVKKIIPEAVREYGGFLTVDYDMIGAR